MANIPSKYQVEIYRYVREEHGNAVVKALAGSGKTSSAVEAMEEVPSGQSVAFLAFNAAIVRDLKQKAPPTADVATFHSIGARSLRRAIKGELNEYKTRDTVMNMLKYEGLPKDELFQLVGGVTRLVSMVRATMTDYADATAVATMVDRYEIDLNSHEGRAIAMLPAVMQALDSAPGYDFDEMIWLPVVKNLYVPQYDVIFIDEVQDVNRAQIELLKKMVKPGGRVIAIGDENQCILEGELVLTPTGNKPIEQIEKFDKVISAIGNGEVATRFVTAVSKKTTMEVVVTITTKSGRVLHATNNHIVFASIPSRSQGTRHTNDSIYYVYMMYKKGYGYRIGITQHPAGRMSAEGADAMWIIRSHSTVDSALFDEALISTKYGFPTMTFVDHIRDNPSSGYHAMSQSFIDRLFAGIDTEAAMKRLEKYEGFDFSQLPHFVPSSTENRVTVYFDMCSDFPRGRSVNSTHQITVETSNRDAVMNMYSAGYGMTNARVGMRYREVSQDANLLEQKAKKIASLINGSVVLRGNFVRGEATGGNYSLIPYGMPAGNVVPGFLMPVYDGDTIILDEVISVSKETLSVTSYDLEVARNANFIVNGIIVHNSIYGFRGADHDAIPNVISEFSATTLPLSITYRCPITHVELAKKIVPEFEAWDRARVGSIAYSTVEDTINSRLMSPGTMVLCRTNAPLAELAYRLIRAEIPVLVRGRDIGTGLIALVKKLSTGEDDLIPNLMGRLVEYRNGEQERLVKANASEGRFQSLEDRVSTIMALSEGQKTVGDLVTQINKLFSDENKSGYVVCSSVHRAKGLEAEHVIIIRPDLLPMRTKSVWAARQERNLQYVAYTRSKDTLVFAEGGK